MERMRKISANADKKDGMCMGEVLFCVVAGLPCMAVGILALSDFGACKGAKDDVPTVGETAIEFVFLLVAFPAVAFAVAAGYAVLRIKQFGGKFVS